MRNIKRMSILVLLLLSAVSMFALVATGSPNDSKAWRQDFNFATCKWSSTGKNDFFILEPGDQAVLDGREENSAVHLEITVLDQTRKIDNVETRVIEERESHDGELEEVSRNYFAVCGPSNDVYYFGEEVDIYEKGKVTAHEGAWVAGTDGAKAGLFMPANPKLGDRYYQEVAPKVAMDRVEIVSNTESLKTPAGEFHDALKTEETTPLEPGAKEYKVYGKGTGIIQDGSLLLTKHGSVAKGH